MSEIACAFLTVPSRFVHPYQDLTDRPYDRVVGFSWEHGEAYAKHVTLPPRHYAWEEYRLSEDMVRQVGGFIANNLASYDPETASETDIRTADFSCHGFALGIRTGAHMGHQQGMDTTAAILNSSWKHEAAEASMLVPGDHAILYHKPGAAWERVTLLHSFISLGDGRTLQALEYGGNLGLLHEADLEAIYRHPKSERPIHRLVNRATYDAIAPYSRQTEPEQPIAF